jgi:hypothetical protein
MTLSSAVDPYSDRSCPGGGVQLFDHIAAKAAAVTGVASAAAAAAAAVTVAVYGILQALRKICKC